MSSSVNRFNKIRGLLIKGLIALAVSVLALIWTFHDVELADVSARFRQIRPEPVFTFIAIQLVMQAVRLIRWGVMVRPLGQPSWKAIFAAYNLGMAATFFIPLRIGEFVRPVMIGRAGVPLVGAMASVVVERIIDVIANLILFFLVLEWLPMKTSLPTGTEYASKLVLVASLALVGFFTFAILAKSQVFRLIRWFGQKTSPKVAELIVSLLASFMEGISVLAAPRRAVLFGGLTVLYWSLNSAGFYVLASAFEPDLPWLAGLFINCLVILAVMIPAGPAFAGTFELGYRFGLAPFGVGATEAATAAVVVHTFQILTVAIFAGAGFWAAGPGQKLSLTRSLSAPDPTSEEESA